MLNVIINGANGRMGQEAVKAVEADSHLQLVATTGRQDDLSKVIQTTKAQVVVDLTTAAVVYENTKKILDAGASPVVGTSGLTSDEFIQLKQYCDEMQLGGIIVPNFSIGAVLMMRYAQDAAKYLPNVEIIEMHHDGKLDAPSGTAIKTAELISQSLTAPKKTLNLKENLTGSRGAVLDDIHIHAIRLPGLVAHQQVLFGGNAETLSIKHDSMHRSAFMPGLILACKKVQSLKTLVSGLEHVMDMQ
ncbi:MAG: 4-hydroxy-tetrahydrodipicolinate reductase [Legionellales bacterium]|nr:4-hydroxy-tetrahydrodipicolinate reductase [Legionellales bacterium]|tara:strand:- start:424 stop:1161 length:738 start_codon:yes stop_codon:yes gene_type:complete